MSHEEFAMSNPKLTTLLTDFAEGRTELVFDLLAAGLPATHKNDFGVSLIQYCDYYGDVSAIRFLLSQGESLDSLGKNFNLARASYHGHWRLCKFLLEQGADANHPEPDTGETPLHAALSKTDRIVYDRVLMVLLANGANPNVATKPGVGTGAFMRDCRTKGETPLHRAAAFGEVETIRTETLHSRGPVGTRVQRLSSESCCMATFASIHRISPCAPTCWENHRFNLQPNSQPHCATAASGKKSLTPSPIRKSTNSPPCPESATNPADTSHAQSRSPAAR
jgi:hypothetical protein